MSSRSNSFSSPALSLLSLFGPRYCLHSLPQKTFGLQQTQDVLNTRTMPHAATRQRAPGALLQQLDGPPIPSAPQSRPQAVTFASKATRKTHVAEANQIAVTISRCIVDVQNNGKHGETRGIIDIYALIEEASRKGIDLTKHQSNQDLYHGPHIKTGLPWHFFALGKIIDIPHPVPNLDSSTASADMNAAWSKLGPLTCKRRPAVIVAAYRDRCKVLPMYTHGKRGLDRKPPYVRELALCVVPRGASSTLSPARTLRCDHLPYNEMEGESIIYATDSYCVNFSWPIGERNQGRLDDESIQKLLFLYNLYQEAGSRPVEEQAAFVKSRYRP